MKSSMSTVFAWASSPVAAWLEQVAVDWLARVVELPSDFGGVLTDWRATMASPVAWEWSVPPGGSFRVLTWSIRAWGSWPAPRLRTLSSGWIHPSVIEAVGMLVFLVGVTSGNPRRE